MAAPLGIPAMVANLPVTVTDALSAQGRALVSLTMRRYVLRIIEGIASHE
jgi:hypothetical protein